MLKSLGSVLNGSAFGHQKKTMQERNLQCYSQAAVEHPQWLLADFACTQKNACLHMFSLLYHIPSLEEDSSTGLELDQIICVGSQLHSLRPVRLCAAYHSVSKKTSQFSLLPQ